MVVFAIVRFFKVKGQMSAKNRKRVGDDAIGQGFCYDVVTSAVDTVVHCLCLFVFITQ